LPLTVESCIRSRPSLLRDTAPASPSERLPLRVLRSISSAEWVKTAPPSPVVVELPARRLSLSVTAPSFWLWIAPPTAAEWPVNDDRAITTVDSSSFQIAPPLLAAPFPVNALSSIRGQILPGARERRRVLPGGSSTRSAPGAAFASITASRSEQSPATHASGTGSSPREGEVGPGGGWRNDQEGEKRCEGERSCPRP
jgi:hypothetical protein